MAALDGGSDFNRARVDRIGNGVLAKTKGFGKLILFGEVC